MESSVFANTDFNRIVALTEKFGAVSTGVLMDTTRQDIGYCYHITREQDGEGWRLSQQQIRNSSEGKKWSSDTLANNMQLSAALLILINLDEQMKQEGKNPGFFQRLFDNRNRQPLYQPNRNTGFNDINAMRQHP